MCFYTNKMKGIAKIVETPITGFKRFKKKGDVLSSPYIHKCKWKFSEEKLETGFEKIAHNYEVNVGLHCYKSLTEALFHRGRGEKVYMVNIPVGALVHENDTQYCSNKMIVEPYDLKPVTKKKTSKRKK